MSKGNMAVRIADALCNQIAEATDALPEDDRQDVLTMLEDGIKSLR